MKTQIYPPPGTPAEPGKGVMFVAGVAIIVVSIVALVYILKPKKHDDEED